MNQYRTQNPVNGEVVSVYATLTDEQAGDALDRAHTAFLDWRTTSVATRVDLFSRLIARVEARADDLARQVTLEMGKTLTSARGEIKKVSAILGYYVDNAGRFLAEEAHAVPSFPTFAVTKREPIGVVLAVEPWNAPLYQAMRATAPNLILGNTVILKPAQITAGSTLLLDELFHEAGFPDDVFKTVLATRTQVSTYIADDRVRAVTFTGSDSVGVLIAEQAARHIKPAVIELGGSDPFLVLASADVARAAATAVSCRIALGGQVCASPKRLIVDDSVADDFVSAFVDPFCSQVLGDGFDTATTLGPLSSSQAVDDLQELVDDAVSKGATILGEGGRVDGPGSFFKPVVLTDVTPRMRLYREEAFGPVAVIYRVKDADAAVTLANDSDYGLNATVFGERDEAMALARLIDTGGVGINVFSGGPVELGFGGTKRSGIGRELGPTGLDAFSNLKSYVVG